MKVRLVGGGLPFTDSNGEGGGGFTTSADAPGPYTITVYEDNDPRDGVADAGGAQASTSFTCEVIPPQQAVQELIDTIDNMDLSRGTTVSLEVTLNAAVRQLDRNNDEAACSQLDAFLNKVDVRENNGRLTSQQATDLRQQATVYRKHLDALLHRHHHLHHSHRNISNNLQIQIYPALYLYRLDIPRACITPP